MPRAPLTHAQTQQLRERVLKVALQEYLSKGFHRATMGSIAKRCRISKLTIYRLFRTKDELYVAVAHSTMPGFTYDLAKALSSGRPFSDVIRDVVGVMLDAISHKSANALLRLSIAERARFPELARMAFKHSLDVGKPLAAFLQAHAPRGRITDKEAIRLAFLLGTVSGAGFATLLDGTKALVADRTAWANSVADLFVGYFTTLQGGKRRNGIPKARRGPNKRRR